MPYQNQTDNSFGHSIITVRQSYPNSSIPDGHSFGEFVWYKPTVPNITSPFEVAVEIAPENGEQKWTIEKIIPQSCSPAQGERALFDLFQIKNSDVMAAIGQIPDEDDQYRAQSAYTRATEWRRESETTKILANLLSLTEEDLNHLYEYAVQVNV